MATMAELRPPSFPSTGPMPWLASTTVDFVASLPPELVLKIALFLGVEDVVRCLSVSSLWYSLLGGLEPYWTRACATFGLPDGMIRQLRSQYTSARDVLFAARRHRLCLRATLPSLLSLSRSYPVNMRYSWLCYRQECLVGMLYGNFKPLQLTVERLHSSPGKLTLSRENSLAPRFSRIAENRVVWANVSGEFLLCACASGLWSGYKLTNGEGAGGGGGAGSSLLYRWRGDTMYDSDIRVNCCEKCCVVCVSKLICIRTSNEDAHWELKVLKLKHTSGHDYIPTIMRFELPHADMDIISRRIAYGRKKIVILPASTDTDCEGFCRVHSIVMQWANKITVHILAFKPDHSCTLSKLPKVTFNLDCLELDEALMNCAGLNTEFCLSSDLRLIGLIFQSELHVWDMLKHKKLSAAPIHLDNYRHEQMKLIALGHLYSIVGLEFSSKLLVIVTRTCQIVMSCSGVGGSQTVLQPPWIDFISATDEQWLSDITHPCSTSFPAVLYWNKAKRTVEGVELGLPAETTEQTLSVTDRRPWWRRKW